MWSVLLFGLAGLLVGGVVSFRKQRLPNWTWISFGILAAAALVAAYLLTLSA
ncbi:hypothetical protein [Sinomonas sp. ASV322]|uniref:hypothetical protein n=1 Tax=Sinomonas sp. ASV322 TaxID=3041920 RepID=UPI0027DBE497|nr:hypothetical protein [Sinomonas sp. ASV322]MDQ4502662.1 hypothetical protein [Sinomonas sp. ASV322]